MLFRSRAKPDLDGWMEDYYQDLADYIRSKLGPTMRSFAQAVIDATVDELGGKDFDQAEVDLFIEDYINVYVTRHVTSSQGQIKALAESEEALDEIDQRMDEWYEKRADKIADNETVRLASAAAVTAFFFLGLNAIWRVRGKSTCPYCKEFNGKVIGKGGLFANSGDEILPEKKGLRGMMVYGPKGHPPLHQGCDCYVDGTNRAPTKGVAEEGQTGVFVPAKTIGDASKWAEANLKTKVGSLKGSQLDHVNDVLKVLHEAEAKTGMAVAESIEFGGQRRGAFATYNWKTKKMHFTKKDVGIINNINESNSYWAKHYGGVPYFSGTGKEGMIWHEIGHGIEDVTGERIRKVINALPTQERVKLLSISGYASEDAFITGGLKCREASAEVISAFMTNKERTKYIPDSITEILEDIF